MSFFLVFFFSKNGALHFYFAQLIHLRMPNYSDTEEEVADLDEEVADLDDVLPDLDLITIPPEVEEYARTELGESEEMKTRTMSELHEMIYGRIFEKLPL